MTIQLRLAQSFEADALYGWLEEWSAWFRDRGIAQWTTPYPKARFLRELDSGHVHCLTNDDDIRGMVTIFDTPPDYHPQELWDEVKAWYLCRVVVPRGLQGTGTGHTILGTIETEALLTGKGRLRIDVVASNPFLASYWAGCGFRRVAQGMILETTEIFMEKHLEGRRKVLP